MDIDTKKDIIRKLQTKKSIGKGIIVTSAPSIRRNKNQTVYVSEHPLDHFSEYHTHAFFEINYIAEGDCINLIEEEIIEMKSGDSVILHPGTFHTLYADESCKVYNFIVEKDWFLTVAGKIIPHESAIFSFFSNVCKEDYYKYIVFPSNDCSKGSDAAAKRLIGLSPKETYGKYILYESLFLEYLSLLLDNADNVYLSTDRASTDYKLINILMYMAENYDTVTLEEVSKKFFYSKTHICRIFTANTGKTFNQTLMQMKISHACLYLKTTDYSVEQISRMIGYDSCEYFQRLFKKSVGMTPGQFRKIGDADKLLC